LSCPRSSLTGPALARACCGEPSIDISGGAAKRLAHVPVGADTALFIELEHIAPGNGHGHGILDMGEHEIAVADDALDLLGNGPDARRR